MTDAEWLALEVGDLVRDLKCGGAVRRVLAVSRVSGKRGQRGKTRTTATVNNLKSADQTTYVTSTEDIGGSRFALVGPDEVWSAPSDRKRCEARSPGGETNEGKLPNRGARCGLDAGHDGDHTVLIPSGAPWFPRTTPWSGPSDKPRVQRRRYG